MWCSVPGALLLLSLMSEKVRELRTANGYDINRVQLQFDIQGLTYMSWCWNLVNDLSAVRRTRNHPPPPPVEYKSHSRTALDGDLALCKISLSKIRNVALCALAPFSNQQFHYFCILSFRTDHRSVHLLYCSHRTWWALLMICVAITRYFGFKLFRRRL